MLRVLFVDDQTLFRESLIPVLRELDPDAIVHEADSPSVAARVLEAHPNLDLALVEIADDDGECWSLLSRLVKSEGRTAVAVLSSSEDADVVQRALDRGCSGYFSKGSHTSELLNGLRAILAGDTYVSLHLLEKLDSSGDGYGAGSRDSGGNKSLSPRQAAVLELVHQGLSNKEVARSLHITEGTVKLHVSSILRALGVQNRTEAVVMASRLGLLDRKP